MRTIAGVALACLIALGPGPAARAAAGPVKLVAVENVYGGIARRVGGPQVEVVSILNSPDQDPHLFEASPAVARRLADAAIVVVNGAGYDAWATRLLQTAPRPQRIVIDVARLMGRKAGDNPHLWYDPATMPALARALAAALQKVDPAHAAGYAERLEATLAALARVRTRIDDMRAKYAGRPVTATEPVFGPMAEALGLVMRNRGFQIAMMNDTEPSARELAAFESDLKRHKVKALIYNRQVSKKLTRRLVAIAVEAKVPVVAVSEMQPDGISFEGWMLSQLDALDKALAEPNS